MKIVLIIAAIVLCFILWKWIKPYFIKYDTTCLFTGGLGAGKTLEAVKTAVVLIRKQRFYKYYCHNFFKVRTFNYFRRKINLLKLDRKQYKDKLITYKTAKKDLKLLNKNSYEFYNKEILNHKNEYFWKRQPKLLRYKRPKPMLYANMPIHFQTHMFKRDREWAEKLTPAHVLLLKKITEYSVVLVDEFPQFINQFEWKNELVQTNVNEWITFFRHYVGGFLIMTAQSESDIVVQIRRKLNQAIWCFDFKKHLFGLFYTNRMCDIMLSDNVATMTTTMIEDNTKLHFGFFPRKGTYDTRCYSIRMQNIYKTANPRTYFDALKTMYILRMIDYISPLDITTRNEERENMWMECLKLGQIQRKEK